MDDIITRISERLVEQSSRRGFFSKLGAAVLGTAALLSGQGFLAQTAEAASLYCCTGTSCTTGGCPSGSTVGYVWHCHYRHGAHYACNDCYNSSGTYICTYSSSQP